MHTAAAARAHAIKARRRLADACLEAMLGLMMDGKGATK
jgi:hypothetical protein